MCCFFYYVNTIVSTLGINTKTGNVTDISIIITLMEPVVKVGKLDSVNVIHKHINTCLVHAAYRYPDVYSIYSIHNLLMLTHLPSSFL